MSMKINRLSGVHKSSMMQMGGARPLGAPGISGPSATRTPAMQMGASSPPAMRGMPMPMPQMLGGVPKR